MIEASQQRGDWSVRLTDTGPIVATFTSAAIESLQSPVYQSMQAPDFYVLHSVDGVNWSRNRLQDIVGEPISGAGTLRATSTQIIVGANVANASDPSGIPKQVLLIGTPRT